jgi:hypothetical protein
LYPESASCVDLPSIPVVVAIALDISSSLVSLALAPVAGSNVALKDAIFDISLAEILACAIAAIDACVLDDHASDPFVW